MASEADREKYAHRKDLTFRQAAGIDPLPKMLAYGELSKELRNLIWDVLYQHFSDEIAPYEHRKQFTSLGSSIATQVLRNVSKYPLDEARTISCDASKVFHHLKEVIFKGEYYDCLEVIQYIVRSRTWSTFEYTMNYHVFDTPISPYTLIDLDPVTIVPRGDEHERKACEENWAVIKTSRFDNAKTHLRQSAEALNGGDARGTIREAILAVEGAARIITGNDKGKLGSALGLLEKEKGVHSALKSGFSSLYGYTSDEKGIRHALMEGDNANVGQDEALFMFSACTAFVAYLARKYPERA